MVKKFDWENYTYRCILGAQYVHDNANNEEGRNKYYNLIVKNYMWSKNREFIKVYVHSR